MKTFQITTPNGNPLQVRTATRTYTHAVVATNEHSAGRYHVVGWASSLALGEKLLRATEGKRYHKMIKGFGGKPIYSDVALVNTTEV